MAKILTGNCLLKTLFTCNLQICLTKMMNSHSNSRCPVYQGSNQARQPVSDGQVPWSHPFPGYDPPEYSSPIIFGKPWADPEISDPSFHPKWHSMDGKVDRRSFVCTYDVADGFPRNPIGRTGLRGRGLLGRWGPNHAADPIVTRWKRNDLGEKVAEEKTGLHRLQFVAILRGDTKDWAIPGGMVDPGEEVSVTLKREFSEEALNGLELSEELKKSLQGKLDQLFKNGTTLFKGYVDDPRNTDNAWMETVATNFHDDTGDVTGSITLTSGDDAIGVKWMDVDGGLRLYASHREMINKVAELHKAFWQ